MKKTILIAFVIAAAVGLTVASVALAQNETPPFGGRSPGDGSGLIHEYMEKAMAEAVDLSLSEFDARHAAGETFYQIALSEGYAAEEIHTLMQDARTAALDAAAKDGIITQEQADWMKSRGFGHGGMIGGYGKGVCPMYEDGAGFQGFGPGQRMMFGGGRGGHWGQNPAQ